MTWNATWPVGTVSVKANKITGNQNTSYIQTTMRVDHYWAESGFVDGMHRQVSMQGTTLDKTLPAGVAGVLWYKTVSASNPRVEMFYRNIDKIYQVSPSFKEGTKTINTSSFFTITDVPANSYGEIFLFTTALGRRSMVSGIFRSDATTVEAWSLYNGPEGSAASIPLKLGNGSDASGLDIRAKKEDNSSSLTWNYRVIYRGI